MVSIPHLIPFDGHIFSNFPSPFWHPFSPPFWRRDGSYGLKHYLNSIFGSSNPENIRNDTKHGSNRGIWKIWPAGQIFGRHLGFRASLGVGLNFWPHIRFLRPKIHRNRYLTQRCAGVRNFRTPRRPFWPPSWMGGVPGKVEDANIDFLFLDIKRKRLRHFPTL